MLFTSWKALQRGFARFSDNSSFFFLNSFELLVRKIEMICRSWYAGATVCNKTIWQPSWKYSLTDCVDILCWTSGPEIIKLVSCLTQLSMEFQLLTKTNLLKNKFSINVDVMTSNMAAKVAILKLDCSLPLFKLYKISSSRCHIWANFGTLSSSFFFNENWICWLCWFQCWNFNQYSRPTRGIYWPFYFNIYSKLNPLCLAYIITCALGQCSRVLSMCKKKLNLLNKYLLLLIR